VLPDSTAAAEEDLRRAIGALRVADRAEDLYRHGRNAMREGGNVRSAVLAPHEGFAVSEYGRHEMIIGE
jgi:hypothetical protein